jgi:hypothetical protein
MRKKEEVDLLEAMDMLDVPEEVLGQIVEKGTLKARLADGTVYFQREQIEDLVNRQIEAVRHGGLSLDQVDEFLLERRAVDSRRRSSLHSDSRTKEKRGSEKKWMQTNS